MPNPPVGDGLGPDPNDPKQVDETNKVELGNWYNKIKRYDVLLQKQQAGDYLTAAESNEWLRLTGEIDDFMKNQPGRWDMIVQRLNQERKANGGYEGTDIDGLLGALSDAQNRNTATTTNIKQTAVTYVDLPTPEEFLDDFTNSYNIHITGLVQTGAIRPEVAEFARSMMGEVFGEYLRERTAGLLKGEPLWKVVGLNADNKLLGSRTGDQTQTDSDSTSVNTSTPTSGAPAAPPPSEEDQKRIKEAYASDPEGAKKFFGEQGGAAAALGGSETTTDTSKESTKFDQTEAIVSRNKLGYVANLAPLDFLKGGANAQRLNLLYGGYKGAAARGAQTATGGESASARRI
jgi:hypothetical protein